MSGQKIRVGILGSTGSVGRSALSVCGEHKELFEVVLLACGSNRQLLDEQVKDFHPTFAVCSNGGDKIGGRTGAEFLADPQSYSSCDVVLNGIGGLDGLYPTLAVLESPARLATANKESIVAFGEYIFSRARVLNKEIIPVDSEHSAVFQCLTGEKDNLKKLILTASGGALRDFSKSELAKATLREALSHPTWNMGLKVTVDSATMMNKGFEVIEAKRFFSVSDIEVLVHRESIVHALAVFRDGSAKACLSVPDMRLPIQYALTYPSRAETQTDALDLAKIRALSFEAPDEDRFPCLRIAREAGELGDYECAVLAAADEVAVKLFAEGKIGFYGVSALVESALNKFGHGFLGSPEEVMSIKEEVMEYTFLSNKELR